MNQKKKTALVAFDITIQVPRKEWEATKRLGFKESDLPGMIEGMISDLAGQVPGRR